jgi:hypothetical protein
MPFRSSSARPPVPRGFLAKSESRAGDPKEACRILSLFRLASNVRNDARQRLSRRDFCPRVPRERSATRDPLPSDSIITPATWTDAIGYALCTDLLVFHWYAK